MAPRARRGGAQLVARTRAARRAARGERARCATGARSARATCSSLVLRFAGESFARVAIFMVRDEQAVGIAQLGLPDAGGPGRRRRSAS